MTFQKATKQQAKLRCALFGPSGSGKTFSALRIATGMGGTVAVIDTERGSASKYADRFNFDVQELKDRTIDGYVAAIHEAQAAGYAVLIVDSLSHGWRELLEEVDRLAKAKYRGNSWSAWNEGTPKQKKMVDAILNYDGHVIATMRTKTEWLVEDSGGKKTMTRVGLTPEQGKGIEYEFDLLGEITPEHTLNIIKDRTGKFQDKLIDKPGENLGKELAAWLSEGAPVVYVSEAQINQINRLIRKRGVMESEVTKLLNKAGVASLDKLTVDQAEKTVKWLESKTKKEAE